MKILIRCLYLIVVLSATIQCGGGPDTVSDLIINEFVAENSRLPDRDGQLNGWVELYNYSDDNLDLSEFSVSIDTLKNITYGLPAVVLPPGRFTIIYFSGSSSSNAELHAPFKLTTETRYVALFRSGAKVDLLSFYFPPDKDESIARNPVKPTEWIHYSADQVTAGAVNPTPGLWKKIVNRTQFEPRDSSPNATLVYNGKIWVFAGYRFTGKDWESLSDVWSSADGLYWELVNKSPPYDPYSSFIVFKNKMWAFNSAGAYSTTDGIHWTNEAPNTFPGGYGARMTIFNNELWFYNERAIGKSSDGIRWQIVLSEVPWEGNRLWPAFLAHRGKLYFFGGGINYMTGTDYYFNDVWSSSDGIHWEQVMTEAPWSGRFWFSYASFDNKLWLMGGWNYHNDSNSEYGNLNDIWVSENGEHWWQLLDSCQWPNRHAPLTWVRDNALYVSSGYGGGGTPRMYNDIWVCTDKRDRLVSDITSLAETMTLSDQVLLQERNGLKLQASDETILQVEGNKIMALDTGRAKVKVYIEGDNEFYPFYLEKNISVVMDADPIVMAYPNPLNVELKVLLPDVPAKEDYLEIYNLSGQLQEHMNLASFSDSSINLHLSLPPGAYVYKLQNHRQIYRGRLVVR